MNVRINRAVLLKPDGSREVLRPKITVIDVEKYRNELRELTGALRVFFDMEEIEVSKDVI